MAEGHPEQAVAACRAVEDTDGIALPLVALIEAQVLVGDLPGAEASLARLSVEDGPLEEAMICRPRATRVGSLLNEARILAAMGEGEVAQGNPWDVAGDFFLSARGVILSHSEFPGTQASPDAGRQALQLVWKGADAGPHVTGRLQAAWRRASRRPVLIHDPQSAAIWLRDRIGVEAARAHALAADTEQKGDLISLAALMIDGGVVCAAEQWPTGDVDALDVGGGAACVFVEGSGGISMDAILAPPAHPLIAMALDMVIASCLARENDHRWFKTGPGMMARALARYLSTADAARAPVCVRPIGSLRRVVHPCRPSPSPTNATRSPEAALLRRSVARLLMA